jgi:NACalpha-BTF3-like transcription factor
MEAQLEAFLRQQLDGGGLRGRAPRQPQPQQPQPQPEDVDRVMDFSGCDRQSAIEALQNNGGDVEAAVNGLLQ